MNCFQHPNNIALVNCKECNKPLCLDCARQNILGQPQVCSEVCAKFARLHAAEEKVESSFDRIYASVFTVLLLAMLGGIFVTVGGQTALYRQKSMEQRIANGEHVWSNDRPNDFVYLYYLGLTDWRVQFALGATIGAGSGLLYVRKNITKKKG